MGLFLLHLPRLAYLKARDGVSWSAVTCIRNLSSGTLSMPYPFDAPRWQFCLALLHDLQQKQAAFPFLQPVDPVAWNIPNYASIILTPMDLSTVERKLNSSNPSIPDSNCENQRYSSTDEFITDVRLISRNCLLFNGADHPISDEARRLEALFDEKIRNLPVPVERRHSALQKLVIRIPPSGIKAKEMEATASNADSIVSLEEKIKILEMEIKEAKRLILHRRGARASESELTISTAITASTTVPSSFVWTTQADTTLLLQVHGSENNAAGFKAAADILGCSTPRACSCRYQKLRLQYSKELDKDTSDWVHLDILNKIAPSSHGLPTPTLPCFNKSTGRRATPPVSRPRQTFSDAHPGHVLVDTRNCGCSIPKNLIRTHPTGCISIYSTKLHPVLMDYPRRHYLASTSRRGEEQRRRFQGRGRHSRMHTQGMF
ncbi:hypothetical protein DFH06DRAFT_23183 [Mycena polygramma]|nr:hypothetical protein DFH06DRAFT_23183 [Mycena polygramma]